MPRLVFTCDGDDDDDNDLDEDGDETDVADAALAMTPGEVQQVGGRDMSHGFICRWHMTCAKYAKQLSLRTSHSLTNRQSQYAALAGTMGCLAVCHRIAPSLGGASSTLCG